MRLWWILGAVLVLEGLLLLLFTHYWRQTMQRMLQLHDGQLRFIAALALLLGLLMMWFA